MSEPKTVTYLERLDVSDQLFYTGTGMLSPGKSYPLACNGSHPSDEERREKFEEWFVSGKAWRAALDKIVELESALAKADEELEAHR